MVASLTPTYNMDNIIEEKICQSFAQIGCPVDEDIKKAHDALGKYLDEMIAVAPDNVMVQA